MSFAFHKAKPSLAPDSPREKARHREELRAALAEFEANGGVVKEVRGPVADVSRAAMPSHESVSVWTGETYMVMGKR